LLALHRFDRAVYRPPLRRPHRLDSVVDRGAREPLSDGRPGHLHGHGARRDAQIRIRRQQRGARRNIRGLARTAWAEAKIISSLTFAARETMTPKPRPGYNAALFAWPIL